MLGGFSTHAIQSTRMNRNLIRKNRSYLRDKMSYIKQQERAKDPYGKVFNEELIDESREEVKENQKRLVQEMENIRWENKVNNLVSLAITAMILLFWLEKCWV